MKRIAVALTFLLAAACSHVSDQGGAIEMSFANSFGMAPGEFDVLTITLTRQDYAGAVTLSAGDLPAGIAVTFDSNGVRGNTATGRITVASSVAPGTYHFTLHASGSGVPASSGGVTLTVANPAGYAMSLLPSSVHVAPGGSGTATLTFTRSQFFGEIFLSAIVPTGMEVDFTPAGIVTENTSRVTIHAINTIDHTTYNIELHGTQAGAVDQVTILTVIVP